MRLDELLAEAGIPVGPVTGSYSGEVGAVRYDSRAIGRGDVFVAIKGTATDGHRYVEAAARAGALAVVVEEPVAAPAGVPCLRVASTRRALADLAASYYRFPAHRLHITGITGTDGKTTSTFLLSHVLTSLGLRTGLLSTVAFKFGDRWQDNALRQSTLESPEVQEALAEMVKAGVSDAVVEATSHGLALDRVRQCTFDDALVTNITSEHLEFHGTRERYIAAKALLLAGVRDAGGRPGPHFAAINLDDEGSAGLIEASPVPVVTYGLGVGARVRALQVECGAQGSRFTLDVDGKQYPASTPLPGMFNVSNCLGVLAVVVGRGLDVEGALQALLSFEGVPGRMKRVDEGQEFSVIVDYAHTAASLEKVLVTIRPLTRGRIIAVFGSAGDRDREKRPAMGAVSARLADVSVFTDEDPRSESSQSIVQEIAAGAEAAGAREGKDYSIIVDRRQAIEWAISAARPGDTVLLAGKGHEKNMFTRDGSVPWNEAEVARSALRSLGHGR